MPSNTFVARLSRGAVASTIAARCFVPESHSLVIETLVPFREMAMPEQTFVPEATGRSDSGDSIILSLQESPKEWTKQMEREFRQLALREAGGDLTSGEMVRLEALSVSRERLSNPRSSEEVLLQLKHDRLLEKISETLRQYVEFQESAHKKRSAASQGY
jgi:hypothetical protein